jgi:glycosyltransferase involved in cell wall biosynthesis
MDSITTQQPETQRVIGRVPRVLFVGHTTYDLPHSESLARKWDSLGERVEFRVVAQAGAVEQDDPRFRLLRLSRSVAGAFHLTLPWVVAREGRRFRPDVVVTQSPYEAFAILPILPLLPGSPKLVVELHGDWRTAARLYGSRFRRLVATATDRAASLALRRADGTRAISEFTHGLAQQATGHSPLATFPTYTDLRSFLATPPKRLPDAPTVAWIGVLQHYKDPAAFCAAWRIVAARVPEARAIIVGDGPLRPLIDGLCAEFPEQVRAVRRLSPPEVADVLDESTVLALPSRSEGLGRVVIEAFTRRRPVVGSSVGGIRDIVRDGRNGLLVPPRDPIALADALVRVLSDRALAERLAAAALADGERFQWLPDEYADAVRQLIDRALALPGPAGAPP